MLIHILKVWFLEKSKPIKSTQKGILKVAKIKVPELVLMPLSYIKKYLKYVSLNKDQPLKHPIMTITVQCDINAELANVSNSTSK